MSFVCASLLSSFPSGRFLSKDFGVVRNEDARFGGGRSLVALCHFDRD